MPAESLGGLVENVPFRVLELQALEDEGLDALEHRREVEVHEGTGHEDPGSDYPQRLSLYSALQRYASVENVESNLFKLSPPSKDTREEQLKNVKAAIVLRELSVSRLKSVVQHTKAFTPMALVSRILTESRFLSRRTLRTLLSRFLEELRW